MSRPPSDQTSAPGALRSAPTRSLLGRSLRKVGRTVVEAENGRLADRRRLNGGVERVVEKHSLDEASLLAEVRRLVPAP